MRQKESVVSIRQDFSGVHQPFGGADVGADIRSADIRSITGWVARKEKNMQRLAQTKALRILYVMLNGDFFSGLL